MRDRHLSLTALAGALGLASFFAVSMLAQAPASGAKPATPATAKPVTPATAKPAPVHALGRHGKADDSTPWGHPDLQGTWFVTEDVPLERSPANANREFLTDEEVAASNKQKAEAQGRNTRAGNAAQDVSGAYNAAFNSVLKTGKRTSRVIDPPDGLDSSDGGGAAAGRRRLRAGRSRAGRPRAGAPRRRCTSAPARLPPVRLRQARQPGAGRRRGRCRRRRRWRRRLRRTRPTTIPSRSRRIPDVSACRYRSCR